MRGGGRRGRRERREKEVIRFKANKKREKEIGERER